MIHLLPLVPRQLDLTGNFLVPQSPWVHTLRVLRENSVLTTFRILRNQREQAIGSISWLQPYIPSYQGAKPFMVCGGSYDLLSPIRWLTKDIIQLLKALIHKDCVLKDTASHMSKMYRGYRFCGHRVHRICLGVSAGRGLENKLFNGNASTKVYLSPLPAQRQRIGRDIEDVFNRPRFMAWDLSTPKPPKLNLVNWAQGVRPYPAYILTFLARTVANICPKKGKPMIAGRK